MDPIGTAFGMVILVPIALYSVYALFYHLSSNTLD